MTSNDRPVVSDEAVARAAKWLTCNGFSDDEAHYIARQMLTDANLTPAPVPQVVPEGWRFDTLCFNESDGLYHCLLFGSDDQFYRTIDVRHADPWIAYRSACDAAKAEVAS